MSSSASSNLAKHAILLPNIATFVSQQTHLKLDLEGAGSVEDVVGVLDVLDEGAGGRKRVRLALQQQLHRRILRRAQPSGDGDDLIA